MSVEAMKQALEALEVLARYENPETRVQIRKPRDGGPIVTMYPHKVATDAAGALRAAIEQTDEQEPVAWMYTSQYKGNESYITRYQTDLTTYKAIDVWPLYTHPLQRPWVGLTDEELIELSESGVYLWELWKAIEAKLKEKNA